MVDQTQEPMRLGLLLRTRGKLPADAVIELGMRMAEALSAAERQGIGSSPVSGRVALTPDSFVVDGSGTVELKPGRATAVDERPGFRTWAAPEQIRGGDADIRAWIFSIAAILYEAATGDALFEAASPPVANSLVVDDLTSHLMMAAVKGRMKATREGLETLVKTALDDDPTARPGSPAVFRVLIAELLETPGALGPLVRSVQDELAGPDASDLGDPDAMDTLFSFDGDTELSSPGFGGETEPSGPGFDGPSTSPTDPGLTSASADQFWDNFADSSFDPDASFPGGPMPGTPPDTFEPDTIDDVGDGLGGQSLEIQLDPTVKPKPKPLRPPPDPADVSADTSADSSIDTTADTELRTARVRPIREIPPVVTSSVKKLRNLVIGLVVLVLLICGTIWLEIVPTLPGAITAPLEAAVAPVAAPLPEGLRTWAATTWQRRSEGERAERIWNRTVDLMPSEVQRQLRPPPDARALLTWPGTPAGGGFVGTVAPVIEPDPSLAETSGRLELSFSYEGTTRKLGGPLTWTAAPAEDPRGEELAKDLKRTEGPVPISTAPDRTEQSGEGHDAFVLPAGFWDLTLTYGESALTDTWEGSLTGVRVAPGHATMVAGGIQVPSGRLEPRVLVDGQDEEQHLTLALFSKDAAKAIQAAEKDAAEAAIAKSNEPRSTKEPAALEGSAPLWSGVMQEVPALPSGEWFVRVAFDDGAHWPTVSWDAVTIPPNMGAAKPTWKLERDEPLNPTGPGLRLKATNFGKDVSRKTEVLLYRAEDDVLHAAAIAKGRAGRYFDVPGGEYNLRLVFQPMGTKSSLFGEKVVTGFMVSEAGVTQKTIDIGYSMAWLDLEVLDGDEDVSDEVNLLVLREGLDRDAGSRTLDEEGVGQHAVPADTYDVYVLYTPRDGREPVDVVFRGLKLEAGMTWEQRWQVKEQPWTARPPKR